MIITVKVKPNSKESKILCSDSNCTASVHSSAREGKANLELISLLSKHFNVSKSCIRIVRGLKGRVKVVEIEEYEDSK